MPSKNEKTLAIGGAVFLVTILAYYWFTQTPQFDTFKLWSESNAVLLFIIIVSIKITGIIWPPLPGGILTLGSIPIIGWQAAYAADFTGSMIGTSIAFFLGKKYGHKLIHKLFDETVVNKIHKIKVKKTREIEAIFALRLVAGNTILEAICYGAGLLGIKYRNFIIGSVASHMLLGIPTFYFASNLFQARNVIANVVIAAIAVGLLYKIKGRYFE